MNDFSIELKIFPDNKSYFPTEQISMTGKTKKEIGEMLIAFGLLLKEKDLADRDSKGRFINAKEAI